MKRQKVRSGTVPAVLLILCAAFSNIVFPAGARAQEIDFDVSASLDWIRGTLFVQASYNLARAGLRLPAGRYIAEEILEEAWPRLVRPGLLSVRVNSSSTVRELVERGETSLDELDSLLAGAEKIPPSLTADLASMTGRQTLSVDKISAFFMKHEHASQPERPLIPVAAAAYTGIIIIANEALPVHGRKSSALAEPCLFPKIWDSGMNLVYERNMLENSGSAGRVVRYAVLENIFRPAPSGLDGELAALAGPYPLRILARELFGEVPTDFVIDREDALKILSTENNRRLLAEGRVIFVLNEKTLLPEKE